MNDHSPETDSVSKRNPVGLAIRSILILGIVSTSFGLAFVLEFGVFNRMARFRPIFMAMGLALWLGPGIAYLWCYAGMRWKRPGAGTGAIATVSVQGLGASALLIASVSVEPVTPVPVVLCAMWIAALADCARYLIRARRFMTNGTEFLRGFELLPAKPVFPMPPMRHYSDNDRVK